VNHSRGHVSRRDQHVPERWRIAHFLLGRCNLESANGIDKTVYYLSSRQAAAGHDVRVVQVTRKPSIPVPGVTVESYEPPLPSPGVLPPAVRDLLFDRSPLNLPRQLVKDLLSDPPDMVHFHHTQIPQAGRISRILRRSGIPYCVTLHGALAGEAQRRRRWIKRIHRALDERRHLDGAAFLHAISGADAAGARAIGLKAPIETVPNGIDLEALRPTPVPRLADRYPQFLNRCVFLFIGRLDPEQKGLDVLLDALEQAGPESALALVGPGFRNGRQVLEEQVRDLGLEDRVVFLGPRFGEQKLHCLCGADGFVHPSRWEAGVPFSVLEAAACALPCLVSDAADPEGVLAARGGAFRVPLDAGGLASVLSRFAGMTPDGRRRMGQLARTAVEEGFAWDGIARRIVQAYAEHSATPVRAADVPERARKPQASR